MNPIAGYSIQETLSASARTRVCRATRLADSRPVILLVLDAEAPSTEQLARLHRDSRQMRGPASEGAIEVLALERLDTGVALVLEDFAGGSALTREHRQLLSLLAAQAALSLENARRLQETQKQLILQEKLASLGGLTSGIAHEIKNPLNFVNNFAELTVSLVSELRDALQPERGPVDAAAVEQLLGDLEGNARKIREHGTRADRIVRTMLEHARTVPGTMRQADINELVREYVHLALTSHRARGGHSITPDALRTDLDASLGMATVAAEDLGRVILNLANNALHALETRRAVVGGGFTPMLGVTTRDLGERFEVRIRDNGGGIPAQAREKVFTPFFTTKPAGQGTGLGLSISHDIIVQGHGGTMTFTTEEGEGTEFVLVLPKRAGPPGA